MPQIGQIIKIQFFDRTNTAAVASLPSKGGFLPVHIRSDIIKLKALRTLLTGQGGNITQTTIVFNKKYA